MSNSSLKASIFVLAVAGLYTTWGRSAIDGTLTRLLTALQQERISIIGIYPIDLLLQVLILFFWEAVDGSHPSTTAVAIYFAGQHLSIISALYINSYRAANISRWKLSATLWLLIFQLTAIGASGPWYIGLYLATSPLLDNTVSNTAYQSLNLPEGDAVMVLPFSLLLGYVVPVVFMGLRPSAVSNDSKQIIIALWNLFPLLTGGTQFLLPTLGSVLRLKSRHVGDEAAWSRLATRITYGSSLVVSFAVHVSIASISITSILFPMVFDPAYVTFFQPGALLIPPMSWDGVSTFGEGIIGFMQWDQVIGYACMLLLAVILYKRAYESIGRGNFVSWKLYTAVAAGCVICGPGATFLALSWAKDELLNEGGRSRGDLTTKASEAL